MGSLQWFNELLTVGFTGLLLVSGAVLLLGNHLPMRQLTGAVLANPNPLHPERPAPDLSGR